MTRSFFHAAVLYLLFVIYGSLVPLAYQPMPLASALSRFNTIPYLDLGIESRADWVANILLYIPLAFLGAAAVSGFRQPWVRALLTFAVLCGCLATAVSIEFTQLFFPPRTVSLNDLIAETIGTGLGILIWLFWGRYFLKLYRQIALGSLLSVQAAIIFYVLIYLALSLFPFDFATSLTELDARLASDSVALFVAPAWCGESGLRCVIKLLVEMLLLMPLAALFSLLRYTPNKLLVSVLTGFLLGVLIEGVQVFLASGVAQGLSIVTRMAGMGMGTLLCGWAAKQPLATWRKFLRPAVFLSIAPYIVLVLGINGWFTGGWLTTETALAKLADTHFLPLYYFYYTTETAALVSLLSNIGSYLPIGVLYWLYSCRAPGATKAHWLTVGLTAALFAILIETGKLFLADKHADPSDILIAFIAAAGTYSFMQRARRWVNHEQPAAIARTDDPSHSVAEYENKIPPAYQANALTAWLSGLLVIAIVLTLGRYPLAPGVLAGFLLLYGVTLWRFPAAWLVALPALLPVLDLAPWTGWFFLDEFDLVVLTTLAVSYFRKSVQSRQSVWPASALPLLGAWAVLYLISLGKGLLPLAPLDDNAFSNYYSNYNSLRVAKGVIWAFLLLPLWRRTLLQYPRAKHYFGYGVLVGLSGVCGFALVERAVFSGLLDFSTDYRINALFSTMHTGGGHIESYLALSLPFVALLFTNPKQPVLGAVAGVALFAGGLYTLLVTFSRGGYIALSLAFAVLLIALLARHKSRPHGGWKPYALALLVLGIVPAMALPVLNGSLIQQRFSVAERDKDSRSAHWRDAVAMMDDTVPTALFGMGLGSYPRTFFWLNNENAKPGTYRIEREADNAYLRLRGGDALFFGQYVAIKPHTDYRLLMDLRSAGDNLALSASLCEKSLQYSFRCGAVDNPVAGHEWTHSWQVINSGEIGATSADIGFGWLRRPVQLSLYNGSAGKIIDVDNIRLVDPSGKDVLANGDFSKGADFWFFATEKHNPWHVFNVWVQVLFEMGWLGLAAFAAILLQVVYTLCRHVRTDPFAPMLLAALSGFLIVGFVDSPFDAPRLTLLFFLIVFCSLSAAENRGGVSFHHRRRPNR